MRRVPLPAMLEVLVVTALAGVAPAQALPPAGTSSVADTPETLLIAQIPGNTSAPSADTEDRAGDQPTWPETATEEADRAAPQTSARPRLSLDVGYLVTDWKRTTVFGALGLLAVLVLIYAVKMLFRVTVLVVCIVGGIATTAVLSGPMERVVENLLPPIEGMHIRADVLGHIAAFLVGYLVSCVVMSILLKPLHLGRRRH